MGNFLSSDDGFSGYLISNDDDKKEVVDFDALELIIDGSYCCIRLGLEHRPGPKNELTLKVEPLQLTPGMTYQLGPKPCPVQVTFACEGYLESLPSDYSGSMTIDQISKTDDKTVLGGSFSIYFTAPNQEDMELRCTRFQIRE
jgi:hypothetical protein